VTSDLLVPRDPLLRRMRALMESERPDLVAGDFNAPRRSRALWPLPPGYSHAYLAAGRGWSYTWPVPCPLYALDQCIVSSAIRPLRYDLAADPASDHRIQLMEFLAGPGDQAGPQKSFDTRFAGLANSRRAGFNLPSCGKD